MDLHLLSRVNGRILRRFGLKLVQTRPTQKAVAEAVGTASVPIEEVDDIRFRSTDWAYSTPVSKMVYRPIFGYGPESWHPLKAGAIEQLANPELAYSDSGLCRFYEVFTPKTIAEAYYLRTPGPLGQVPASSLFEAWEIPIPPYNDPFGNAKPSGTPAFGPLKPEEGEQEWTRIRRTVDSIRRFGYQPDLFPRGRIEVTVLRSQGDERYLVRHGNHRAAVLAAMGQERVTVGVFPWAPWVVDERDVSEWPFVRSGFLTEETAVGLIRRYFKTPDADPALEIAALCSSPNEPSTTPPAARPGS